MHDLALVNRLVPPAHRLADTGRGAPVDAAQRVARLVASDAGEPRRIGEQACAAACTAEWRLCRWAVPNRHGPRPDDELCRQLALLAVRAAFEEVADGEAERAERERTAPPGVDHQVPDDALVPEQRPRVLEDALARPLAGDQLPPGDPESYR